MLDILELFYNKQKVGLEVTDSEGISILGRGEIERWSEYITLLEDKDIVKRTQDEHYVLCRNLSQIDFWSLYKSMPYPLPRREDLGNIHPDDTWIKVIGPALLQSDDYLAAKLSIPLSHIFETS